MSLLDKLFGSNKSPSNMSDRELQRKLNQGIGKNTGESIASRASYIREGQKRDITANQKKS